MDQGIGIGSAHGEDYPDALILVMATEPSDGQIQQALAAGARGCLRKGMPMTDVLAMIRKAHANRNLALAANNKQA